MLKNRKKPLPQPRRSPVQSQRTDVFSYHSSRSSPDAQRARYEVPASERTGLQRLKHTPTVLAGIVIVATLLYASFIGNTPRMQVLASTTGQSLERPSEVYSQFIEKELSNRPFNRSKFTFDAGPLTAAIKKEFPEVDNVAVSLPLIGHKPIVTVAVSSPAFVLASSQGAYYINDKGLPMLKLADVAKQPQNIPTLTDETNLPITAGKQVLPSDTVSFAAQLLGLMAAADVDYQTAVLPLAANEIRVKPMGVSYYVRFNTLQDPRAQLGTYLAVKKRLVQNREEPKEYIDVRVEDRAYYK